MNNTVPSDPQFESRIRSSFAQQKLMQTIGACLVRVSPGECDIELPFRDDLTQQHGYLHAGVVTSVLDSACGYAALSMTLAESEVLSVEFKINLLAPANGSRLVARGRVIKPGRKFIVCMGDAFIIHDGKETHVATMLATMAISSRKK